MKNKLLLLAVAKPLYLTATGQVKQIWMFKEGELAEVTKLE